MHACVHVFVNAHICAFLVVGKVRGGLNWGREKASSPHQGYIFIF